MVELDDLNRSVCRCGMDSILVIISPSWVERYALWARELFAEVFVPIS